MAFGYEKFAQDAQCVRNSLVYLDALAINDRFQGHVRTTKALSLVWMAAAVESFWKSYLAELCQRVATAPLSRKRRHLAAVGIFYFDALSSMGEGKKLKRWGRVAEFFSNFTSITPPASSTLPYDGRTVRPDHFDVAWRVFSLPGRQFPSHIHKQVLITLADRRNDVAHGLLDPQVVGGLLTIDDLKNTLQKLEDIVENSVICAAQQWP